MGLIAYSGVLLLWLGFRVGLKLELRVGLLLWLRFRVGLKLELRVGCYQACDSLTGEIDPT